MQIVSTDIFKVDNSVYRQQPAPTWKQAQKAAHNWVLV